MGFLKSGLLWVLWWIRLVNIMVKRRRFISLLFSLNWRNERVNKNNLIGIKIYFWRVLWKFRSLMILVRKKIRME